VISQQVNKGFLSSFTMPFETTTTVYLHDYLFTMTIAPLLGSSGDGTYNRILRLVQFSLSLAYKMLQVFSNTTKRNIDIYVII